MINVSSIWDKCLNDLKYQVSANIFTMWLRPLSVSIDGGIFIIKVPNEYFVAYISEHHLQDIRTLVFKHGNGNFKQVVVRVDPPSYGATASSVLVENMVDTSSSIHGDSLPPHSMKLSTSNMLNEAFTFETFVTGKSNSLAYKACYEISKCQSSLKHNPLFIYGPSGLGKTHLMHSVAHRYVKSHRSFHYFTSEKFVSQMVAALQRHKIEQFKQNIKKVDLLIIDDIHILAGKRKSSDEFLSLFSEFTNGNKQLILASDRHPSQLTEFDERFRSRFAGGLSVAIDPPEIETRVQILQKKAVSVGLDLPKDCALFIAQNVVSNVRRLEGALNQVRARVNLTGDKIDLALVQIALKDLLVMRVQAVNMDSIRKVVAEYYGVSVKDLIGKKRTRSIARPRQIAMALSRDLTGDSFPDIGQSFGGRDHTTVMHACDKIAQLRSENPVLDKEYRALSMMLQAG